MNFDHSKVDLRRDDAQDAWDREPVEKTNPWIYTHPKEYETMLRQSGLGTARPTNGIPHAAEKGVDDPRPAWHYWTSSTIP